MLGLNKTLKFKLKKLDNEYYLLDKSQLKIGDIAYHPNYLDGNLIIVTTDVEADVLMDGGSKILASTRQLTTRPEGKNLPLIDNDEIEARLDSEELAIIEYEGKGMYATYDALISGFMTGFNKHAELNVDKKFTQEEMITAIRIASGRDGLPKGCSSNSSTNIINYIKNKQEEVEWDCEIEGKSTNFVVSGGLRTGAENQPPGLQTHYDYEPVVNEKGFIKIKSIK